MVHFKEYKIGLLVGGYRGYVDMVMHLYDGVLAAVRT